MKHAIDETDRRILQAIQEDARLPVTELAERVGLSATPCKRRLSALEEAGLIEGYHARLNRRASGYPITVFVFVELERQEAEAITRFEQHVGRFEEVVGGVLLTGSQDFMLEVAVRDLEDYERFLQTRLMRMDGIRAVRSRFALRRFIDRARLP
ncbi:Lrp/AsnC family transcriptional regulator [Paracoccaceae bacterium GXU_MW_L88]